MYKIVNGKKITSAVVIIDSEGNILGCHGTGKPAGRGYDFPKGCVEEDEADIAAAIREAVIFIVYFIIHQPFFMLWVFV